MKIINKIFSIIVVMLVIMGVYCNKVYANENIKVHMNMGFENSYKLGQWTPFDFKIENKLKDIDGEIQVELVNQKDEINVYSKKINLPLNSTKTISLSGIVFKNPSNVRVKILNGKEVVYDVNKPIKMNNLGSNLVVGFLSDEPDSLNYIKGIQSLDIGGNTATTKYLKLGKKDLEKVNGELEIFNVIFLNNFDTSNLSKPAYNALKDWINEGGILIVGTGSSYNKTLEVFKDDFLSGDIGAVRKIQSSRLSQLVSKDKRDEKPVDINFLEMNFKDGEEFLKEGKEVLTFKINRGKGVLCVNSFDFAEEPFTSWKFKEDFATYLMNRLIKESNFGKTYAPEEQFRSNYDMMNALNNLVERPIPKGNNILIILCIYLVIVSPVTYLILKKKDKREYIWAVVPVMSILFVGILYMSGMGTRITNNMANIINIARIDDKGRVNLQAYVNIFSPRRNDIKVQKPKGMDIYPIALLNQDNPNMNQVNKNRKIQLKFNEGVDGSVEFYDTPVFSNNYLKVKSHVSDVGKIDSNISYYDGKFIGKIKNNSRLDLQDCWIVSRNNYINIGNLKKGEEKSINDTAKVYNDIYNYVGQEYFTPDRYPDASAAKQKNKPKSKSEYRQITQKRDVILGNLIENRGTFEDTMLLGWSNTEFSKDFMVNGKKVKKYEKSFVMSPISITFARNNKVEYPFGYFKPEYIQKESGYNDMEKAFFGKNHEITFNIKEKVDIESIRIKYRLDLVKGKEQISKQFIWNVKEEKWEEGDFRDFTVDKNNLKKYVSPENILKIKLEMKNERTAGEMPQISVKGSVK